MRTWLKRMVAGIVSAGTLMGGGLLMAGTANADEIRMPDIGKTITSLTASAATTYPRELVNGGFDYLPAGGWNVISPKLNTSRGKFTSVDPVNGQYIRNAYVTDGNVAWVKWDGFDASKFGWISDQKGGKPQGFVTDHANSVELQRDNDTDNTYAEIVGSEIGKSIYQKIDTQSSTDAVYTVRFDHAALSSEHADGMQALVNGKPVTMTRIGGNKAGDKTGWTGTDIVTHATNTDHYRHDGQWATYEGKVTIPANTPVSTFTFKSLNEAKPDMGNLIDNLTFKIAYRLSYDSNGGTKAKASQISSMTEGKASETDGKVKTVADDAAGRTVLECKRSGEGATGPYADKFCWIDWSNLPLNRTGEPIPVRINVPDGHIDADATVAHTDNAALTAKDYTGNKWSRLIPAYRLTGNTALAFSHIQGNSADPLASVMFSNITPVVNQTATSVNVLKDFQLAFGDAETMSGYVVNDKKIYEQTDIESDKTLDKLGMIGDNNPNQSYSEANTGYGTTHVTLAGGPAGAHALTDEADSKGAAVIGATQPTRFKVSFKQVNHPADDSWSAIAIGVYMPYLTAYPLTYDKNGRDATGSVPSNETAGTVRQTKSKTNGSVRLAADDDVAEYAANGLPDHLVNGDFEYPVKSDMPANDGKFWYISQNDGSYFANGTVKRYKLPEGFDKAKFAWHSTQTGDTSYPDLERADDVQVDYKADGTNHYSEISAAQSGATIYQDVATVPGAMYKWSLKHASLDSSHLDKMSVIIGEPGKETAQEATRTTANGHGDKLGKVGTVISTKVSNPENKFQEGAHTGQWETYTGTYIATGTVTRFAFHSVEGYNAWNGNLLDDISFSKAYKLTYDKNASDATGSVPSDTTANTVNQAKADATGTVKTVTDTKTKTSGTVKTVADTNASLPDHLVNGDFSVNYKDQWLTGGWNWTSITPDGKYLNSVRNWNDSATIWKTVNGWDKTKFGWSSTQKDGTDNIQHKAGATEIQYDDQADNVYAELCAYEKGTAIYQDIKTVPGVLYKIRLKHASLYSGYLDKMQVLIGAPGHETPVEMTRTSVNGHGDKLNEKSTVIATKVTNGNNRHHESQWETYEGTYLIPDGQATTRFTFKSIDAKQLDRGNVLDDIVFDKAYRLSYDKNATDANGSVPSSQYGKENTVQPAKSKTTGSVGLAADKTASGLTVHDLKKNDKGKVPSNSKADSTQPAAFKAPDAKAETIASRAAGDELAVNGGFDTPKWTIAKEGQGLPWVYVKPNAGTIRSYAQAMAGQTGVKAGGLTAATFAWQDLDAIGSNQNFELHREKDGNTAADVHAGRTVAQTVNTTPGASYTFSIRHSGRSKGNAGGVTLLTGPDKDHLTPVKLTRTTVSKTGQKYGDKTGDVGTVAYTHSDSMDATEGSHEPWDHSDDWESYEGTVIIPAGQSRTMIAYRGVAKDSTLTAFANDSIIDDLSFRPAYKLSYDANGGAKKSTSQIKASTDGKVKTIAGKTDSLPTELVNGSFDYPAGLIAGVSTKYPWDDWTVVDPINGRYARHIGIDKDPWAPIPGWDASKFAWKSTQTKGTDWQQIAQGVELQKDSKTGNQYAELVAGQAGTAIYQDIATIPGVSYRWTLKHASLDRNHLDGMSVMIGEPGKESAQDARRTTVNGNGDQPGDVGKVISTKVSNDAESNHESNHSSRNHDGQWETYTGTYIATGTVTRFTFKSVSSSNNVNGNILDDLSFTKAYRLGYDANGGAKTNASKISASSNGTVRLAATRTSVPSHALEDTDVPADYRSFTFDTTRTRLADARFDGNWTTTRDEAGGSIHWPTRLGASATLPNTGTWTDPDGVEHRINATIALKQWNGGNIGQLNRFDGNGKIVGDGLFWINVVYDNTKVPASVRKALGGIDTSKRVGCQWTVSFTYEDGTPVPSTFKGVTGFNDLDGFDARPDLKFEGVQLLSGFDGAYRTRDAELASYGTNGYAGIKHDAGDESNLNGAQQVRHRLAATWTGPTFTYSYDLENPTERTDGVRMTFGMPVTRTQVLTYKANGGTGQVPSRTEAGKTETAASRMNGTVRLAADRDTEPESGTTTDDRKVLTDTIARQDDGTSQRTITRSDGSVQVQTIADTGAVSGCQVYYPAGAKITLATAKADSDCWDSSQISKTNRTFYGWSANTDANDKDVPVADTMDRATLDANAETQITMPARAKTVYALWAINPTLTYNVNAPATTKAPDAPASMTVPYNTAADDKSGWTVGDTGKITGYSFDGWYTSPTGGDKYDWSTKLTNDVTMYAHWTANGYTVKYDAGGGKGTMGDQKFTFDVPQNLSPNAFTRDGYTFTGWKRADTGDSYTDGQQVSNLTSTPNGIVTMIAQWTPNPASINYDPNPPTGRTPGGQGTANWTGHTGDTQAIGANGWTVDGYTFIGWNTSADGKGTAYAPGTTWTANGTLTLYAQWTPGQASLTYDGNGATGGKTDPQTGKTDEKINVRDNGFTRDGYTFVTWNTQADCKGNAVKPNSEWTLRGSSTLYACWAGNAQTLTYHGNGATGGNTAAQSGKTGDELTTNANGFTRDGYTFVRWDTAKDGSGTAYGEGKNGVSQYVMKPAGNDLYAIWKANPATIQYRNDWPNTTGSTPDTTGNTGDTVTISQNSFDRPGYTFTGWSTSKRGDPSLQPGDKHTLEPRTTTVWAQWKADPAHLVYNSNIGTVGSETKTVDGVVDQTVKTITNPFDRPGYTFSGWNTQADGKGKAYATGADYVLTANDKSTPKNTSVLYAQWKINGASLKFNPNGGIGHVDDVTGDAFSTVTIPGDAKEPKITRPGYRFVGWSTEKNPPAGSTFLQPGEGKVTLPAEGSTTVYAQWEPSLTTLPFTGGQAQVPTIWLYAGFALMLIALGVMMPMLRTRMAATKRTGKHMPITGGKHAK